MNPFTVDDLLQQRTYSSSRDDDKSIENSKSNSTEIRSNGETSVDTLRISTDSPHKHKVNSSVGGRSPRNGGVNSKCRQKKLSTPIQMLKKEGCCLDGSNKQRTRSLNAPCPVQQLGPCGRIMKNSAMTLTIQDPASQRLTWNKPPLTVLVIKKIRDAQVIEPFIDLVSWLIKTREMVVYVEKHVVFSDPLLVNNAKFHPFKDKVTTFEDGVDDLRDKIDLIICLGGDGTLIYASSIFQQSVPPIISFHLGSLGFLTHFQMDKFQQQISNVLDGNSALTLRSRLSCQLVKLDCNPIFENIGNRKPTQLSADKNSKKSNMGWRAGHGQGGYANHKYSMSNFVPVYGPCIEDGERSNSKQQIHSVVSEDRQDSEISHSEKDSESVSKQESLMKKQNHHRELSVSVLNEVVIDRGPSPYLSNIDLYLDNEFITSVQGDGLILSTPTGSTAYAVAAGASMIHPSVPAIMITPICPHSLSFRPIVVPAGVELKIKLSPDCRNTAWLSFDGRNRQELCHGESLQVTTSIYPIPSVCARNPISDWFNSLAECLHWNVRKRQKPMLHEDYEEIELKDEANEQIANNVEYEDSDSELSVINERDN